MNLPGSATGRGPYGTDSSSDKARNALVESRDHVFRTLHLVDLPDRLEVLIKDLRSVVRCPWCGFKTTKVHETRRVKVKDVERSCPFRAIFPRPGRTGQVTRWSVSVHQHAGTGEQSTR
jgi:hypothetical protein